jgi:hypothetical protein
MRKRSNHTVQTRERMDLNPPNGKGRCAVIHRSPKGPCLPATAAALVDAKRPRVHRGRACQNALGQRRAIIMLRIANADALTSFVFASITSQWT